MATYKVVLHAAVPAEIKKLPVRIRARVKAAISSLADEPIPLGSQKIRGRMNVFRIRFGDYCMIYEVHATEIVVYVVGVAHRREVYRRILRRS